MNKAGLSSYEFVDYSEHAISVGSDSKAISYIHIKNPNGKDIFGIGVSHNIGYASMKGIFALLTVTKRTQCVMTQCRESLTNANVVAIL